MDAIGDVTEGECPICGTMVLVPYGRTFDEGDWCWDCTIEGQAKLIDEIEKDLLRSDSADIDELGAILDSIGARIAEWRAKGQ